MCVAEHVLRCTHLPRHAGSGARCAGRPKQHADTCCHGGRGRCRRWGPWTIPPSPPEDTQCSVSAVIHCLSPCLCYGMVQACNLIGFPLTVTVYRPDLAYDHCQQDDLPLPVNICNNASRSSAPAQACSASTYCLKCVCCLVMRPSVLSAYQAYSHGQRMLGSAAGRRACGHLQGP